MKAKKPVKEKKGKTETPRKEPFKSKTTEQKPEELKKQIMEATMRGDARMVVSLMDMGADAGEALLCACSYGKADIVKAMMDRGINVNRKVETESPLGTAASNGHADVVELLLSDKKAEVDVREEQYNMTPLIMAAQKLVHNVMGMPEPKGGYARTVKLLLEAGADVDAQDKNGCTALILASSRGYADIVKLLLDANADTSIEDKFEKTALDYALKSNRTEVVKLLEGSS